MSRLAPLVCLVVCGAALVAACFGSVLFRGEQYSFRDAGMYYYPLYHRVQTEWAAGRWPLWDDGENGGVPLLGNPTAAVLYPPKFALFATMPYPWAVRLYAVGHVLLAAAGMFVLVRQWGVSWAGAGVAALGYAFSGPMLSLTANIIFLVGAAWLPWGLWGADRWVRLGKRDGLATLAVVLALQILGGDPEAAYLLGLSAAFLAWVVSRDERIRPGRAGWRRWLGPVAALTGVALLAAARSAQQVAAQARDARLDGDPRVTGSSDWIAQAAWIGLAGTVAGLAWRWRASATAARLRGLLLAAGLGGLIAAVQIIPALEFTRLSDRGDPTDEHRDTYASRVEPLYLPSLIWPNLPGTIHEGSRAWVDAVNRDHDVGYPWFLSYYPGLLVVVLGMGAAVPFRDRSIHRSWLTIVVVVGLLAALGKFGGPLWWLRYLPSVAARVGPHDPPGTQAIRYDGFPLDAWGSPYWVMVQALPGFGSFRYPAKVFTLALLALCGLAGLGWDRSRRVGLGVASGLLLISVLLWAGVELNRPGVATAIQSRVVRVTPQGPLDVIGAVATIRAALVHAVAASLAILILLVAHRRWPNSLAVGVVALCGLTLDLSLANAPLVISAPQAIFDHKPRAVEAIERAERADPTPGPFRVHRLPIWQPEGWLARSESNRLDRILGWEVDTLAPKYNLLWGIDATETYGVGEIQSFHSFFDPFRHAVDARGAALLGIEPGRKVLVAPRRGYDLWTTRYFILPANHGHWTDPLRATASLLESTDQIDPPAGLFTGPGGDERRAAYTQDQDVQILRNRNAFPRAWVVHDVRFDPPRSTLTTAQQILATLRMLHQADSTWTAPGLAVEDLRRVAHVETNERAALAGRMSGRVTLASEAPRIARHEPGHVEIDVTLTSPGLVVLADQFYPGWRLTVDGRDAPILRVNQLMRGAAVDAGRHHLVFQYRPRSVAVGAVLSAIGLVAWLAWVIRLLRRVRSEG